MPKGIDELDWSSYYNPSGTRFGDDPGRRGDIPDRPDRPERPLPDYDFPVIECWSDTDCGAGSRCINGKCVKEDQPPTPPPPSPTPTPSPGGDYTDINYWLNQGKYPWKEQGFGGGRAGYDAWAAAGFPGGYGGYGITAPSGADYRTSGEKIAGLGAGAYANPYGTTADYPPTGLTGEDYTMDLMNYFNFPPEWGLAGMTLADMAETGMPVDINAYAEAQLPMLQTQMSDWAKQAAEEAGLAGTRWSSPLQRTITDYSNRLAQTYGADISGKWLGAQEAARGRQMGGATGLMGLGSLYSQLPLQVSQQMMNMSGQMQGMGQREISPLYNEFMRTAPESNPWMQMLLGSTQPGGYSPQMYQQGSGTQWLGLLGQMLPSILGLLPGGG